MAAALHKRGVLTRLRDSAGGTSMAAAASCAPVQPARAALRSTARKSWFAHPSVGAL
jgi:hypothetical protein